MQEIDLPLEKLIKLKAKKKILDKIENYSKCRITIGDKSVVIESKEHADAYGEFLAYNIINAFEKGFDINTAFLLVNEEYYFSYIDINQVWPDEKRKRQIKARIIGENGRTKRYIESVSSAKISVHDDFVGFIGKVDNIAEAETAVRAIINGGTHKQAYNKMEARHRKNKSNAFIDY